MTTAGISGTRGGQGSRFNTPSFFLMVSFVPGINTQENSSERA